MVGNPEESARNVRASKKRTTVIAAALVAASALIVTVAISVGIAAEAPDSSDVPSIRTTLPLDLTDASVATTPTVSDTHGSAASLGEPTDRAFATPPEADATQRFLQAPSTDAPGTASEQGDTPAGDLSGSDDADDSDDADHVDEDDDGEDRETVKPPVRDEDDDENDGDDTGDDE